MGAIVAGAVDTPIPLPPVEVTAPAVPWGLILLLVVGVWWAGRR